MFMMVMLLLLLLLINFMMMMMMMMKMMILMVVMMIMMMFCACVCVCVCFRISRGGFSMFSQHVQGPSVWGSSWSNNPLPKIPGISKVFQFFVTFFGISKVIELLIESPGRYCIVQDQALLPKWGREMIPTLWNLRMVFFVHPGSAVVKPPP